MTSGHAFEDEIDMRLAHKQQFCSQKLAPKDGEVDRNAKEIRLFN